MKTCSLCRVSKSVEDFYANKNEKCGRASQCKVCCKLYYLKNRERLIQKTKTYAQANTEKILARRKEHRKENRQTLVDYQRNYAARNPEKVRAYKQKHQEANRERRAAEKRARYASDPQYALTRRLSTRLNLALKGRNKAGKFWTLVGCDRATLTAHLERQFQPGMTWENRSAWHVDHIKPISSFNLSDPEEQFKACHYTNLQPLWAIDNLRKGAKT